MKNSTINFDANIALILIPFLDEEFYSFVFNILRLTNYVKIYRKRKRQILWYSMKKDHILYLTNKESDILNHYIILKVL